MCTQTALYLYFYLFLHLEKVTNKNCIICLQNSLERSRRSTGHHWISHLKLLDM